MTEKPTDQQILFSAGIINGALMTGATVFLLVVLGVTFFRSGTPSSQKDPWIWIGLTLGVWLATRVASAVVLKFRERKLTGDQAAEAYLQSLIVRMALHEGPTMIGIVGLLILLPGHPPAEHPEVLLLALPYTLMMLSGISRWPTEERFREEVRLANENEAMRRKTA